MESALAIVVAATSVTEHVEEDDIELFPESSWIDAKLCEDMSSKCSLGSTPARGSFGRLFLKVWNVRFEAEGLNAVLKGVSREK